SSFPGATSSAAVPSRRPQASDGSLSISASVRGRSGTSSTRGIDTMRVARLFGAAVLVSCAAVTVIGQSGAANGEWRSYGGDLGHTRYSPLSQIDASNFSKLEIAWRFKTDSLGPRPEFQFESTPLMVKGIVYTTAGSRRAAVALDAATGEMLWMHSENEGARGA